MVERILFSEVDDNTVINGSTIAKYLESSIARVNLLKEVYKGDGVFIFANNKSGLKNTIPFLVPNSRKINEIQSLIGLNVTPSVKGFYINLEEELTLEQIKNIIDSVRGDNINIKSLQINDDIIELSYIYPEEILNPLIRGDFKFDVDVKIKKISTTKLIVSIIHRRTNDFKEVLELFKNNIINNIKGKIIKINVFDDFASYSDRNNFLKDFLGDLPKINFKDDDEEKEFEILGVGSWEAFRNNNENLPNEATSFAKHHCNNLKSRESSICTITECIEDVEGSGCTSPMNFEFIYKSPNNDFIIIEIKLKKDIEIMFKSYKKANEDEENELELHKKSIMELSNKIINKDIKINHSLELFWHLLINNSDRFIE